MTVAFIEKQRDLFTKGWQSVKRSVMELRLHQALVARLRLQCRPGVMWFHVANGEIRSPRDGAKLKSMGLKPGVADLIFIWAAQLPNPGGFPPFNIARVLFLELKSPKGRQSPAQKDFQAECGLVNAIYEMADNIDDAVAVLRAYEILPSNNKRSLDNGAAVRRL